MSKLTVAMIAYNEQDNIGRCLQSLQLLSPDEVIVVLDDRNNDQTEEIARKFKVKIIKRRFDNFANQKNYALENSNGEWVFFIDADELITSDLANDIKQAIASNKFDAFLIPRRNFILGAEIKHSRWSPDKHIWLFKRSKGKWVNEVHEEVEITGSVGEINSSKIHYQNQTLWEFIQSNSHYAKLQSEQRFNKGESFSLIRVFWDPFFEFCLRYIYKLGFLDGWRGLVLSLAMAYYQFEVWLNILYLQTKRR